MPAPFLIRLAEDTDVPAMTGLRREAERWLASRGITQWTRRWETVAVEKLQRATGQRRAWVVEVDGTVGATVTLGGPDEDLWRIADGPALYLYKLIVARRHAGLGIGAMLCDWACDQAALHGYPALRLDVWHTNTRLIEYYSSQGFTHIRTELVPGRDTGALFERPAVPTATPKLRNDPARP